MKANGVGGPQGVAGTHEQVDVITQLARDLGSAVDRATRSVGRRQGPHEAHVDGLSRSAAKTLEDTLFGSDREAFIAQVNEAISGPYEATSVTVKNTTLHPNTVVVRFE